jgi:hypothetical protein
MRCKFAEEENGARQILDFFIFTITSLCKFPLHKSANLQSPPEAALAALLHLHKSVAIKALAPFDLLRPLPHNQGAKAAYHSALTTVNGQFLLLSRAC